MNKPLYVNGPCLWFVRERDREDRRRRSLSVFVGICRLSPPSLPGSLQLVP